MTDHFFLISPVLSITGKYLQPKGLAVVSHLKCACFAFICFVQVEEQMVNLFLWYHKPVDSSTICRLWQFTSRSGSWKRYESNYTFKNRLEKVEKFAQYETTSHMLPKTRLRRRSVYGQIALYQLTSRNALTVRIAS